MLSSLDLSGLVPITSIPSLPLAKFATVLLGGHVFSHFLFSVYTEWHTQLLQEATDLVGTSKKWCSKIILLVHWGWGPFPMPRHNYFMDDFLQCKFKVSLKCFLTPVLKSLFKLSALSWLLPLTSSIVLQ